MLVLINQWDPETAHLSEGLLCSIVDAELLILHPLVDFLGPAGSLFECFLARLDTVRIVGFHTTLLSLSLSRRGRCLTVACLLHMSGRKHDGFEDLDLSKLKRPRSVSEPAQESDLSLESKSMNRRESSHQRLQDITAIGGEDILDILSPYNSLSEVGKVLAEAPTPHIPPPEAGDRFKGRAGMSDGDKMTNFESFSEGFLREREGRPSNLQAQQVFDREPHEGNDVILETARRKLAVGFELSRREKSVLEMYEFLEKHDIHDLRGTTSAEVRLMTEEEKRIVQFKRRLRNRESAKRSREKKKQAEGRPNE